MLQRNITGHSWRLPVQQCPTSPRREASLFDSAGRSRPAFFLRQPKMNSGSGTGGETGAMTGNRTAIVSPARFMCGPRPALSRFICGPRPALSPSRPPIRIAPWVVGRGRGQAGAIRRLQSSASGPAVSARRPSDELRTVRRRCASAGSGQPSGAAAVLGSFPWHQRSAWHCPRLPRPSPWHRP